MSRLISTLVAILLPNCKNLPVCKVPWLDYYSEDDGYFRHYEADLTFVLGAAQSGQSVICILSDDANSFVLLVYWVNWTDMQCKVQMEGWDRSVLDFNATCAGLGQNAYSYQVYSAVLIQLPTL